MLEVLAQTIIVTRDLKGRHFEGLLTLQLTELNEFRASKEG